MSFSGFGTAGGMSGSFGGGAFGTSGTPGTSSIFGQPTPASSAPATGGIFSGGASTGQTPMFGGGTTGTQPPLSFGSNAGSKPASGASTPSLFGGNNTTGSAPTGGMFGGTFGQSTPNTTSASTTGSVFSGSGMGGALGGGGGGLFGQNTPAPTASSGLFPNTGQTGGNLFGKGLPQTTSAAPAGSTTPAGSKFSFNSTTPAGPPPAANGQAKPLFPSGPFATGSAGQSPQPSMFSNPGGGTASSTPGSNPFGNNKSSNPVSSGATPAPTTAPAPEAPKPTFGFPPAASTPATQATTTATATTSLFGPATTSSVPTSNLFSGLGGATTAASQATPTSNIFGGLAGTTTAPVTSASTPGPTSKSFFGPATITAPAVSTSTPATTSAPVSKSGLGGLGGVSSGGLGGLGTPPTSSSATPSTTAPATSNLFGPKTTTTQPPATAGMAAPGITQPAGATQPLGASVSGPTPQQSRLKNKTMDEIITRWASDLLKYQKEFQEQATKVASWDRLLVENGEKIQTLSDSTHEADRATREIDSQLSTVEGQQIELTAWLDRYEAEVDDMFASKVGPGENLQGPDQERERTYKTAEKLTDRLDEMGKNITSMIDAINDASTNASKNAKADNPLSHIVRVLNSHLTQLQWIDQNTEVLQAKVAAASKMGQSISSNGYGGLDNDTAESFYRAFNNRR